MANPGFGRSTAQVLSVLGALVACAGWPGGAGAQTLAAAGSPLKLAGAGSFVGQPSEDSDSSAPVFAESPVDGSFEFATLRLGDFPDLTTQLVVTHFGSGGKAGPAVSPSQGLGTSSNQLAPTVTALQQGGFVVAWNNVELPIVILREPGEPHPAPATAGDVDTVSVRLLDGSGQPVGAEIQLSPDGMAAFDVRVAALSSGGFVATWLQNASTDANSPSTLMATLFSTAGEALTGAVAIGSGGRNLGLVGLADGGFIAAWGGFAGSGVFWQRWNAAGTAVAAAVQAVNVDLGGPVFLAANPAGQVALAWMTTDPASQPFSSVLVQLYGAGGSAAAAPATVATWSSSGMGGMGSFPVLGGLAVDREGQALVAWRTMVQAFSATASVQLVGAGGELSGAPVPIDSGVSTLQQPQVVVAENDGSWSVLWADADDAFVQSLSAASCSPSGHSLCLDGNRFRLDLQFADPLTGGPGTGNPVPLADDSGALWFFDPSTPELVAKVIDGSAVNGHFWLFFASLTDVEFDLTVTDTQTGAQRTYHNPAGTLASQADTSFPLQAAPSHAAQATVPPAAAAGVTPRLPVTPRVAVAAQALAAVQAPAVAQAPAAPAMRAATAEPVCNSSSQALCLLGSEFAVTVTFRETAGSPAAAGQAVQLSDGGGYYWFFGPDDTEIAVKVLDGRAVNGHVWVFYASLTDVEFDLTVTDSFSPAHARRTYHNPAGNLASAADVNAF